MYLSLFLNTQLTLRKGISLMFVEMNEKMTDKIALIIAFAFTTLIVCFNHFIFAGEFNYIESVTLLYVMYLYFVSSPTEKQQ